MIRTIHSNQYKNRTNHEQFKTSSLNFYSIAGLFGVCIGGTTLAFCFNNPFHSNPDAVHERLTESQIEHLPIEHAILTSAPNVPPPITRKHPVLMKVALETNTREISLTDRFKYAAWTFNGTVPGPMIRARVGDIVEVTLTNTDESGNPHNIDCHGFEGQ
jgi:FtsP/CotA-like multicopper oxidase with cupredoxin domain